MAGSGTKNLFGPLEFPGPRTDAHASQQGYVEFSVDAAVVVATRYRDAALPLQHPEVLGTDVETPSGLADVHYAVHVGTA